MRGWTITKDILSPDPDDDLNSVGVSNADIPMELWNRIHKQGEKPGYEFRLYDDDGELYYIGRVYDSTGEYDEELLYEIFKWGAYDSGTARLTFPRKKNWEIS